MSLWRVFFGGLHGIALVVILSALIVRFGILSPWIAGVIWLIGILVGVGLSRQVGSMEAEPISQEDGGERDGTAHPGWWFWGAILIDTAILIVAFLVRTENSLATPFEVLPWWISVLFVISSTGLIQVRWDQLPRVYGMMGFMVHAAVFWGLNAIVFGLGFGFDPFVHQAAERVLVSQGWIEPRSWLYAGQYGLIASVSVLTGVSVKMLDLFLGPVLAAMSIPVASRFSYFAVFLMPIAALTFTIPFSLALVFFACTILLATYWDDQIGWRRLGVFILPIAAGVSHPLIGIPAFVFAALSILHLPTRVMSVLGIIAVPIGLLIAFGLASGSEIGFQLPIWEALRYLFGFAGGWISIATRWLPIIAMIFVFAARAWTSRVSQMTVVMAGALFLSAIALTMGVRVSGIRGFEQFEFALRLLAIVPLVLWPNIALLIDRLSIRWGGSVAGAVVLFLMMTAWILQYPSTDGSRNIGSEDVAMARAIELHAAPRPYAVLAPPIESAAGLEVIGFGPQFLLQGSAQHPYPIPAGGELARISEGFLWSRDFVWVEQLFQESSASSVYAIIPKAETENCVDIASSTQSHLIQDFSAACVIYFKPRS